MLSLHPRTIRRIKSRAWDLAALLGTIALCLFVLALAWVAMAI